MAPAVRLLKHAKPLPQKDVDRLPGILKEISPEDVRHMQVALSHVWRRVLYSGYPLFGQLLDTSKGHPRHKQDLNQSQWLHPSPPASYHGPYEQDDAFGTIMQWLFWRLQERTAAGRSS